MHPTKPTFRELDRREAEAVLARNHVGRMAYLLHGRPDIVPLHYVYADGWIYARTAHGQKLGALGADRWVAFEVDETEGLYDWRSVVVHGGVYPLSDEGSPVERTAYEHAVNALRQLVPQAFGADDPVPDRMVPIRIEVAIITGRSASSGG